MSLLIRTEGKGQWHVPKITAYPNEARLQSILVESPSLLPGVPEEGSLAVDEVEVTGPCYVDVLCIDLAGQLTLCECKLRANAEIKRWIVGQLMAYAAALWRTPYEEFDRQVSLRLDGRSLEEHMELLADSAQPDGWSIDAFRAALSANLTAGRFRLVFAVDEITDELRRVVEFLNTHTAPGLEVLAVEIGYVEDGGVEILSPTVYGTESARNPAGQSRGRTWDRSSFLAELSERDSNSLPAVEALMNWAVAHGATEFFGRGAVTGSWYPVWGGSALRHAAIAAWTDGSITINVAHLRHQAGFDEQVFISDLRQRLKTCGIVLSPGKDFPWFSATELLDEAARDCFLTALRWLAEIFPPVSGIDGTAHESPLS